MSWILKAKTLQGRLGQWSALLSPWEMTFVKAEKGESEILGVLAASISPRSDTDEALEAIRPRKVTRQHNAPLIPRRIPGFTMYVASFDGSAKAKQKGGAFAAVLWRLDGWLLEDARSGYVDEATVNEAEYRGAFLELELALEHGVQHVVLCGDSNLIIRQLRGDMACNTPALKVLKAQVEQLFSQFSRIQFLHMKRAFNQPADLLAGQAQQRHQRVAALTKDTASALGLYYAVRTLPVDENAVRSQECSSAVLEAHQQRIVRIPPDSSDVRQKRSSR